MANRKYTDSQRAEATELILSGGQPAALVARDMSVSISTVHRWVSDALSAGAVTGSPTLPVARSSAGSSRDCLELQLRDALHRLGKLEAQLERLVGCGRVAGAAQ